MWPFRKQESFYATLARWRVEDAKTAEALWREYMISVMPDSKGVVLFQK